MAVVGFNPSVLQSYYSAKLNLSTPSGANSPTGNAQSNNDSPDVVTPWEEPEKDRPLASKMADLRGVESFINMDAESVQRAGEDVNSRNLFAMYNGLSKLKDIAEYAAHEDTVNASLDRLDSRFQSGMQEINDFLKTAEFEDAQVLFGEKSDSITSRARLGERQQSYTGALAHVGSVDDPLDGITGNETFTISISDGQQSDDITVDLSQISGDITLKSIVDAANDKIQALTDTNDDGETVERYRSRLTIETKDDMFHHMKVRSFAGESVELSAGNTAPSLMIGGTIQKTGLENVEEGFLTSLKDLDSSDPTAGPRTEISATAAGHTEIAANQAEESEDGDDSKTETEVPAADTRSEAVATDSDGNTYVVGTTSGDFGGQFNQAEGQDVYLSKFDSAGQKKWTRLLGTAKDAGAYSVTTDSSGNAIVAGETTENLTKDSVIDSTDSFVTKYSGQGEELFTQQVQVAAKDGARGVTVDGNGDIYVAGRVNGKIDASASDAGNGDSYVQKLDGSDGTVQNTHQFGTAGTDTPAAVATASDGNILVLAKEDGDAVLRKLDAADPSSEIFSVNLGSLGNGDVSDIAVDGSSVYVAGSTDNSSFGGGTTATAHHGGKDGFVVKLSDGGSSASPDYTSFVGSGESDRVTSVNAAGGQVYAVGEAGGSVNGETQINSRDAFAVKMAGSDGTQTWTHQFGSGLGNAAANGVAINDKGDSILSRLGLPSGQVAVPEDRSVVSQSSVRPGDEFYLSINGGRERRIEIEAGDTMHSLARKIDNESFRYLNARASFSDEGNRLTIEAEGGAKVDVIAGEGTADALKGLGIEPTKIVHEETDGDESDGDSDNADSENAESESKIWGLGLDGGLHLRDKKAAEYTVNQLGDALSKIRTIHRKLNSDPSDSPKDYGPAPAYLQERLANYQAGLNRLQGGGGGGGSSTAGSLLL